MCRRSAPARKVPRAIVACLALAACGRGGATSAPERPIEVLVASDGDTLDPRAATDAVSLRTTRLVHAGLVRLDPSTLEPRPYVAKGWSWLDDLTLRVELRDDVRFHSGAPVRAADVAATVRVFRASRHASVVEAIDRVEPDGDRALVVTLRHPHATLLTDLELPILRADQADLPPDPCGALDGLGPYEVTSCAPGAVVLRPAPNGAMRATHAVVVRTVHDENARAMRLYAGRADVALNQISPTLLPALERDASLAVTSRPGANLTYVVLREASGGPLDDARVRRAIAHGIDRATLTSTLFAGHAHPAKGLLPEGHWAYAPVPGADEALAFDPAAARALLDAAGVRGRLALTLLTSTDRLRVSVARVVAQELEDVGIDVEVVPLALGTLLARLNAGDFELAMLQLPEMTEPHVLRNFLHSAFVPPAGPNRGRVRDAELDALLDEGGRERDAGQRRAIYARATARVLDQMHLVPLWQEDQVAVTSARARAFQPSAEGRWLSLASIP